VRSYTQGTTAVADLDACSSSLGYVRGVQVRSEEERGVLATSVEAVRVQRAGADDEGQLPLSLPSERRGVA
jgi:exonuclease SbcD